MEESHFAGIIALQRAVTIAVLLHIGVVSLCVVGVTDTAEIFISVRHYYYVTYRDYIGCPIRTGGGGGGIYIEDRVNAWISVRDVIRLRDLVAGETNHYDDAMYIVLSRRIGLDMRSRAVINYYVARTEGYRADHRSSRRSYRFASISCLLTEMWRNSRLRWLIRVNKQPYIINTFDLLQRYVEI